MMRSNAGAGAALNLKFEHAVNARAALLLISIISATSSSSFLVGHAQLLAIQEHHFLPTFSHSFPSFR